MCLSLGRVSLGFFVGGLSTECRRWLYTCKGYEEKLTMQKHRARVGPAKKKMKVAWTLAQKK